MPKKQTKEDVKIIIQYQNKNDENNVKTFQNIMQKLFNLYIIKAMQNINKDK